MPATGENKNGNHGLTIKQINTSLRAIAERSGKSQSELAKLAKCSQSTVSAWLSKRTNVNADTAKRLAKVLGYRLDVSMELTKEK